MRIEILDEVAGPEDLAGPLVECEQLFVGADREQPVADDERRRMRAGAEAEVLAPRRIFVFPQRLAGRRVHGDHGFLGLPWPLFRAAVAGAIHGEEASLVDENRRVAGAERPRPDHRRAGVGPLVRESRRVDDEIAVRSAPLPPRIRGRALSAQFEARRHQHDRGDQYECDSECPHGRILQGSRFRVQRFRGSKVSGEEATGR